MEFMERNAPAAQTFDGLIEAESQNLQTSMTALGSTAELIGDFQGLYQSLAGFVRLSGDGITPERAKAAGCALLLLMKCRSDLLLGSLNLLRGYQGNSLRFLRGAIEACAFAARIKRHPHLADVWLHAVDGDAEYKTFRDKFTNLFPDDDVLLHGLHELFDQCSQVIHNSVYSMAGHFSFREVRTQQAVKFNVFDLPEGPVVAAALCFTLGAHKRILTKFTQVLADNMKADAPTWQERLNSVGTNLGYHREKWKAAFPDPRKATP